MSIRNLKSMFQPSSVAFIGASPKASSVGGMLSANLFAAGFAGPIMPVNPKHGSIRGVLAYPDIASLPVTPELAVIATPPEAVPGLIGELGARGTKAAVVITAGFSEGGNVRGMELQQATLNAARTHLLRIIGPNCLGILVPESALNASFAQTTPIAGDLAFVAQSGAIVTAVLDWATERGIGFSHLISLGDMADVDFGDMLDYLSEDRQTRAILLYIEAVTRTRKFMSAARAAARSKPVIVVKAGRHAEGAKAVASHTGALAGADAVYDAAFRRAGMLRVKTLPELFDAVQTLALARQSAGERLAILTNGGGIGILATDALIDHGGRLAELSRETLDQLNHALPPTWSQGNPVDIIGDAPGTRYMAALDALLTDPGVDAVVVLHCPTAVSPANETAAAVVETVRVHTLRGVRKNVFTSWVGNGSSREARRLFAEHRIATYDSPEQAVQGFMHMVHYRHNQEALIETPPSVPEEFTPDVSRARAVIDTALSRGHAWLTEPESKDLLAAYGIMVVPTRLAATPEEAGQAARELGGPVALKIVSPDITHKTDVGGVMLGIKGGHVAAKAAAHLLERVAAAYPGAVIDGVSVQPMVHRPDAYELLVGMTNDPQFGPVLLFGQGGTAAEVVDDTALALPPLNMRLAHDMMSRTRIYRLLQGYRGRPAAALDQIALVLLRLAQLVIDFAEVEELDINPLLADSESVVALDARVRVAPTSEPAADRLVIRPYPKDLEERLSLGDGRTLLLRPVRPEDEPSLQAIFATLTPEEIRLRFLVPMKTLSHLMGARFTQIDYDREMVLVLTEPGVSVTARIFALVQINADPNNETAEYAILVHHDVTGMGLGIYLMRKIIDLARQRGLREIYGDVLAENTTMLRLCKKLGFKQSRDAENHGLVRVTLTL
jgi:acetyltransferase